MANACLLCLCILPLSTLLEVLSACIVMIIAKIWGGGGGGGGGAGLKIILDRKGQSR